MSVLLMTALVWSGCQRDDDCEPEASTGNLRVTVAASWDGVPYVDGTEYTNIENYRVELSQLRIYLGDIMLQKNSNELTLARVELFDLLDGPDIRTYTVAPGNYTGLDFGIGVPMDLNNADPVGYGPDHPLYLQNGTYWNWTTGYRFSLFDGTADTTGTGSGALNLGFSMHPGLDTAYREVDYSATIAIAENTVTDLMIDFDVSRFFYNANDTIYLKTENQLHGNNSYLNKKLADLMQTSVTVSQ